MATTWKIGFENDVALLSLDDGKANVLLTAEFQDLERALDEIEHSKANAVVLHGRAGYFSAGLNLKVFGTLPDPEKRAVVEAMGSAALKLFLFSKPVVAAVTGHALGGGAMFGLAADVRLFAEGAFKFGLNEVPAGLIVPSYAIELAVAALPASALTTFLVHGATLSPSQALAVGLAESVHPPEALLAAAIARATALTEIAGTGYAMTKRLVREPRATASRAKLPAELDMMAKLLGAG